MLECWHDCIHYETADSPSIQEAHTVLSISRTLLSLSYKNSLTTSTLTSSLTGIPFGFPILLRTNRCPIIKGKHWKGE